MTYQELINKIVQLQEEGLELFNAGKSVLGKNILATHIGDYSGPQVLFQAGIHSREYITTLLLIEMARNLHNNQLVTSGGIYFIFLTNPDGAEIALDGLNAVDCEITKQYFTLANGGNLDFSKFKANYNLVDLNTNFDANWGQGTQNVFCPSVENFVGFYPNSEREVQSLINFTLQTKPLITVSYHSKGNIIYYGFDNQTESNIARDQAIGNSISELTGYPLIFTENSTGGYKDWCIDKLKIPAYTIEVGDDSLSHPIGEENLPEIYQRNKDVPLLVLEKAKEYSKEIDFNDSFVQNIKHERKNKSNESSNGARLQSLLKTRNSNRCRNSKR